MLHKHGPRAVLSLEQGLTIHFTSQVISLGTTYLGLSWWLGGATLGLTTNIEVVGSTHGRVGIM